jgi:transposase InsO family protein
MANNCPNRTNEREQVEEQVNYTLFTVQEEVFTGEHAMMNTEVTTNKLTSMVKETLGMALLDSGCTKTVVGKDWLSTYLDMIDDDDLKKVSEMDDCSTFRFGDGNKVVSNKVVKIPGIIGSKHVTIEENVVNNDIPLLLSRNSMKKANMIVDFNTDKAVLFGEEVSLHSTKCGHYCLPLTPRVRCQLSPKSMKNFVLHVSEEFKKLPRKEKKQKAFKLHQQFAHPSEERLVKLLKESKGFKEDKELLELIKEVTEECQVCKKFTKPKPRPIVGMPLAREFNEVVCMDLFEFESKKVWVLHFIDAFSRRSNAVYVKTKKDVEIIKHVYSSWIRHYGTPRKFLADNGGEFANEKFKEMNEKLNIEVCHTAAESPWSNGMVERHNAVLKECLEKTLVDTKCDPEIGLAWAVSAKNSLFNNNGFTPDQLTYGRNCNYSSILTDEPPALESGTTVDVIRENMDAMHRARTAFIESESSERIRRALRHNIRTYANETYESGDKVYYRRKGYKGWKGPGVVIGKDGQTVLIKHGSTYCRVHPCKMMKKRSSQECSQASLTREASKQTEAQEVKQLDNDVSETDDEDDDDYNIECINERQEEIEAQSNEIECDETEVITNAIDLNEEIVNDSTSYDEADLYEENDSNSIPYEIDEIDLHLDSTENEIEQSVEEEMQGTTVEDDGIARVTGAREAINHQRNEVKNALQWPKNKSYIEYEEDGVWKEAFVLSSQPKRNGKNKEWLNIHVTDEEAPRSIAWREVNAWKVIEKHLEKVLLLSHDEEWDQAVINAKSKEISNLNEHNVYEEVKSTGKECCISTRWIVTEKFVDAKKITKARLVARGFEEDSSLMTKDSPTCTKESLRIAFTVAATQQWKIQSLDISSAFLQGNEIQRDVYVLPPKDIRTEGVIWKLKRCIYGLNDAPRAWYDKVKAEMILLGASVSKYDHSFFMWHEYEKLIGVLVTHVDDFTFAGTAAWETKVIGSIRKKFKISAYHSTSFKYIGLSVEQRNGEIQISQSNYAAQINPIQLATPRKKDINGSLTVEEKKALKALSGQMMWVTNHTRPDMSFESCVMSNAGRNSKVKNIVEANKAVMKMKKKDLSLKFCGLANTKDIEIVCYADATHASLEDGSSQGAYIVAAKGKLGLIPLSWQSKKLHRITKSPLASEASAICEGADATYLIAATLKEVYPKRGVSVVCKTDSMSLCENVKTTKVNSDKRLRVDISRLKEMITEEEIKIQWIEGKKQLADALTKRGASTELLVEALRM